MAKMDEEALLSLLQSFEDDAAQFVNGPLQAVRDRNVKDYFRRPFGNEEPGWSQYVSSDTMDTIEWMLPDLLDMFVSNDKACEFQPTNEREVKGAEQATQGVNHVFYQQNPGFWVLMSAFKDALLLKTCAVTWRKEEQRVKVSLPLKGVSQFEIAASMTGEDDEIEAQKLVGRRPVPPRPLRDPQGNILIGNDGGMIADPSSPQSEDVYDCRISRIEKRTVCKVECFEPENLGVYRAWTTPYLQDCPYVVRWMEVTLSELNQLAEQMGFDRVDAEELASSQAQPGEDVDRLRRNDRTGDSSLGGANRPEGIDNNDESQTLGWLRMEWVLADYDGDGIAERRCIYRLDDKILWNEECSHVPVATGSPIPVTHRWDGMSVAEALNDLTLLHSELMRGVINNAFAANNPRKLVLTDSNGAPYANIDDLMDSRPGINLRITRPDAVSMETTSYVGNQFEPLLQRIDMMREQRTGVTKQRMGMDPNAIRHDRTLGETRMVDSAAKQRIKLIARVFAETIVIPMFRGILKVLTEGGDFDPFWVKIAGSDQFQRLDPNEWRDSYSMIPNVGLGTGDEEQKFTILRGLVADQVAMAQSPLGPMMVTPRQMYNTRAKMLELSGMRNVGDFYTDPRDAKLPTPPPAPPPYQLIVKQKELEFEAQKLQFEAKANAQKLAIEHDAERQRQRDQNEVQQANDARDAEREAMKANYDDRVAALQMELDKYKTDQDNMYKVIVEWMKNPGAQLPPGFDIDPDTGMAVQQPNRIDDVLNAVQGIYSMQLAPAEVVRDEYGTPTHIRKAGIERPIVRNPDGSVAGVQ